GRGLSQYCAKSPCPIRSAKVAATTRCACSTSTPLRPPTARSLAVPKCPGLVTNCIISDGTRAALCPYSPHPHVERRYLMVPGLRSSRIHILDTKPDPLAPKIVKVIEAKEIAECAGYSRPHTFHCGPDAIYVSAMG